MTRGCGELNSKSCLFYILPTIIPRIFPKILSYYSAAVVYSYRWISISSDFRMWITSSKDTACITIFIFKSSLYKLGAWNCPFPHLVNALFDHSFSNAQSSQAILSKVFQVAPDRLGDVFTPSFHPLIYNTILLLRITIIIKLGGEIVARAIAYSSFTQQFDFTWRCPDYHRHPLTSATHVTDFLKKSADSALCYWPIELQQVQDLVLQFPSMLRKVTKGQRSDFWTRNSAHTYHFNDDSIGCPCLEYHPHFAGTLHQGILIRWRGMVGHMTTLVHLRNDRVTESQCQHKP